MNLPLKDPPIEIWIIDDDQSMRWVLEKTLSNNGYQVTAFESASVALSNFKRTEPEARPRLIITDVRMPGINGFELLKQIKNISPQTPIIVMTAYTDLDTTVQAFHEGAFEYLPKPFDIDDALTLVARACEPVTETGTGQQRPAADIGDWQAQLRLWAKQQLSPAQVKVRPVQIALEQINIEKAAREAGVPPSTLRCDLDKVKQSLADVLKNQSYYECQPRQQISQTVVGVFQREKR